MIYIKVYSKRGNIMHHWKSETIHGIETIYDNKKYRPYGHAGRFRCHISEAFSTKKNQSHYLNNAIRKYGVEDFVV